MKLSPQQKEFILSLQAVLGVEPQLEIYDDTTVFSFIKEGSCLAVSTPYTMPELALFNVRPAGALEILRGRAIHIPIKFGEMFSCIKGYMKDREKFWSDLFEDPLKDVTGTESAKYFRR